ncbi:MAG: hypothetical protein V4622_01860 [Bacteroidota bacterium]
MKNILKSSLFLFALSLINLSYSQEVKKQEPVKKIKYDAAKNKPLKKEKVNFQHISKKKVVVKK